MATVGAVAEVELAAGDVGVATWLEFSPQAVRSRETRSGKGRRDMKVLMNAAGSASPS